MEEAVRSQLEASPLVDFSATDDLTCGLLLEITHLSGAGRKGITSLVGIENLTSLTHLYIDHNSITDISALRELTWLRNLHIDHNSITDISALRGFRDLRVLKLGNNSITDFSVLGELVSTLLYVLDLENSSITDISWLSEITSLTDLFLQSNRNLTDIQPLLDNPGFGGPGTPLRDAVNLRNTNVSCADVALLEAKGVSVESDCP